MPRATVSRADDGYINVDTCGDSNSSTTYETIRTRFLETPMVALFDPDAARLAAFERWLPEWTKAHAPALTAHVRLGAGPQPWSVAQGGPRVLIGLCVARHPLLGYHPVLRRLYAAAAESAWATGPLHLVLASPDDLGDPVVPGVQIFDARTWHASWREHRQWADGVAARLKRLLNRAPYGSSGAYLTCVTEALAFTLDASVRTSLRLHDGARVRTVDAYLWTRSSWLRRDGRIAEAPPRRRVILETKNQRLPAGEAAVGELHERLMRMPVGTTGVLVAPHGVTAPAQRLLVRFQEQGALLYSKSDAQLCALVDAQAARCGAGVAGTA